ncbi:hypothetical protein QFZ24_008441 [Streptomyces phaeochromogenes]|nr:hypothetical protein [Streptomyces phaeochromogenes]
MQHEGGQGVGDGGRLRGEDAVAAVQDLAAYGQARLEFRRVQDRDLGEDEVLLGGDVVVRVDLLVLLAGLGDDAHAVRKDTDAAICRLRFRI